MITDKNHAALTAAHLAMSMADNDALATEMITTLFADGDRDDAVFELVQQYRFTGESLYLHHCGLGMYGDDTAPWLSTPDDFRLALTLYCANVPILAAFIPPEVKEDPKPAHDPRRGFDSINDDADNMGTIYEREMLHSAEGESSTGKEATASVASANSASSVAGAGSDPAAQGQVTTGQEAAEQGDAVAGHAEVVTANTDSEAELGADPADPAPAPDKPMLPASAADPDDDRFSGGDVVDDDERTPFEDSDDDDDDVVGDDPPPPPVKNKKKKA